VKFRPSNTVAAILISLFALFLFDIMGLIIKYLSPRYTAAELSSYRNIIGLVPSVIALWSTQAWHRAGRPLRIRQWKLGLLRGAIVTFAQLSFYLSLGLMSFASATTISYSNALFMTAFAVPLLGEKVGPVRWIAVLIGFVGVVFVMGPGRDTFSPAALLPVAAGALYALVGVTSRLFDDDVPTPVVNLYSAVFAAGGAYFVAQGFGGFSEIQQGDLIWIIAMGTVGGCAVLCLIVSYRMTEQSNLAPFSYFGIPLAFVLGWLVFDEAPWSDLFPGAILIAAGGLMIVWRERRLKAQST
jgi:drug/metabolite transporter (DMT)-like permease